MYARVYPFGMQIMQNLLILKDDDKSRKNTEKTIIQGKPFFLVLQDKDKIGEFLKSSFDWELEEKEVSLKGWNWGTATFKGTCGICMDADKAHCPFESPTKSPISNINFCFSSHQNVLYNSVTINI